MQTDRLSSRESLAFTVFSLWAVTGLFLDGWSHNHHRPETFFTPWHAVLYSGVSQKRTSGTTVLGDASLRPFPGAASYFYSLTLKLVPGAAPGAVFDGQNLGAKFHAAVRDRSGTDVFQNADFALGRLEIR